MITIKTNKKGEWVDIFEKKFFQKITHLSIIKYSNNDNSIVSFFTSQPKLKIKNEIIENFKCESNIFKFMNPPVLVKNNIIENFFDINNDESIIHRIIQKNVSLIDHHTKKEIVNDVFKNFKNNITIFSLNKEFEKYIFLEKKLLNNTEIVNLEIKERKNIIFCDKNGVIFNDIIIKNIIENDVFINSHNFTETIPNLNKNTLVKEHGEMGLNEIIQHINNIT